MRMIVQAPVQELPQCTSNHLNTPDATEATDS